jgi:hypothetical protein
MFSIAVAAVESEPFWLRKLRLEPELKRSHPTGTFPNSGGTQSIWRAALKERLYSRPRLALASTPQPEHLNSASPQLPNGKHKNVLMSGLLSSVPSSVPASGPRNLHTAFQASGGRGMATTTSPSTHSNDSPWTVRVPFRNGPSALLLSRCGYIGPELVFVPTVSAFDAFTFRIRGCGLILDV